MPIPTLDQVRIQQSEWATLPLDAVDCGTSLEPGLNTHCRCSPRWRPRRRPTCKRSSLDGRPQTNVCWQGRHSSTWTLELDLKLSSFVYVKHFPRELTIDFDPTHFFMIVDLANKTKELKIGKDTLFIIQGKKWIIQVFHTLDSKKHLAKLLL